MRKQHDLPGLTELLALYDRRLERTTNWDLIDLSVYNIMDAYWLCADTTTDERHQFLQRWADSGNLWRERAAMVSTLAMIRRDTLGDTFWLAEYFINHPHDLMHKASGWMLREAERQSRSMKTLSSQRPRPSMEMRMPFSRKTFVKAKLVNWLP